jgi:hypothetical protein
VRTKNKRVVNRENARYSFNKLGGMQRLRLQLQREKEKKQKKKFMIEERRRTVTSMLAQSMTEIEIAKELNVHFSTISRDVTYLKKLSQQFVFDLAKSDLAFYYHQSLNSIDEVKRKAWDIYLNIGLNPKDKLLALRLIKECEESKFSMFKDGPFLMNIKTLEEKLSRIESTREICK